MSCIPLKKKLLPSKKAWRSFTSKLQSRLQMLKRSKPIKQATTHLKKKVCAKKLHNYRSFAPVYVDELFQTQPELMVVDRIEPPREVKKAVGKSVMAGRFGATTAGSSSSSRSPFPFEPSCSVDTRAEMFISRFKESLRLEKQKSVEEYQEMLARGL